MEALIRGIPWPTLTNSFLDFVENTPEEQRPVLYLSMAIAVLLAVGIFWYILYVRFAAKNYKNMLARRSAGKARDFKNVAYSRELPFKDSLPTAFSALNLIKDLPNQSTIVGAILLDWIRLQKVGLQNNPSGLCIYFYEAIPALPLQETALYHIFLQASGPDRILQPHELQRWGKQNPGQVAKWIRSYDELGLYLLHETKAVETRMAYQHGVVPRVAEQNARVVPGPPPPGEAEFKQLQSDKNLNHSESIPQWLADMNTNVYFTKAGRAALAEAYGFKKYLKDFSVIETRLPQEVHLWQRYLVFAQLFGNAVAVSKSFAKTYPATFSGDENSSLFLQAILSGLADALDKAWFEVLTAGAKNDPLGTRK